MVYELVYGGPVEARVIVVYVILSMDGKWIL